MSSMENIQYVLVKLHEEKLSPNEYTLIRGCQEGNLETIQWLLSFDTSFLCNCKCMETCFCVACENGRLDVAKILYISSKNFILNADCKIYLLHTCCEDGYYDLFVWLLFIFPDFIYELHEEEQYKLFLTCCENFNFHMAKYLFNMYPKIPINLNNDEIFINACNQNMVDLAKMLVYMRPQGYYLHVTNGKIDHYEIIQSVVVNNIILEKQLLDQNIEIKECLICYEHPSNIMTNCKHFYCFSCIEKHYEKNNVRCPYCRCENYEHHLTMIF